MFSQEDKALIIKALRKLDDEEHTFWSREHHAFDVVPGHEAEHNHILALLNKIWSEIYA